MSEINIAPYANKLDLSEEQIKEMVANSPLGEDFVNNTSSEVTKWMGIELAKVWHDFDNRLNEVPVIKKLNNGEWGNEDYKALLINLRQQVVEGGRWISLCASSMEQEFFMVRSAMIGHAAEEHRDYQMLEKSYTNLGGNSNDILTRPRNVGSEAFTAYMFHQAGQKNPLQLFGAMFMIEGLGHNKATGWGEKIKEQLNLEKKDIVFLAYHGEHDLEHFNKLKMILSLPQITQEIAVKIVKTAKTVGRLYCLQLEELDNY